MRFLSFYQVQFGLLDETSLLGHARKPRSPRSFHVKGEGLGHCRHVPLSRLAHIGPGVGKQLQRVFQLSAPWVLAIASLNVIEFFLA